MLTVKDVMTTTVISVHPADPVKDAAQLLVDRQISGVPVVDAEGVVVGVVSEADFRLVAPGACFVPSRTPPTPPSTSTRPARSAS